MQPNARVGTVIWGNVLFLVGTAVGALILTPLYVAHQGITWAQVITFMALWWATGLSITAGYHRLFAHRAYRANVVVRAFYAVMGAAACQNSIITWCAAHRYHHRDVDTDGDPYNAKRGFAWSHMGWVLVEGPRHRALDNVPDLWNDPICRFQHRHYWKLAAGVNLGVPLVVGALVGDVVGILLFAGLVRLVVVQHATFCINSIAHMFGTQPWSDGNSSRDSWWLSWFTFGEGYHNYHHAFQRDYRNGPKWYNYDPTKWTIWGLARVGLTEDLMRTPKDVVLRRRYREELDRFAHWRSAAAGHIESAAERLRDEQDQIVATLTVKMEETQRRFELALEELTCTRKAWMRAARERGEEWSAVSKRDLRAMRRAVRRRATDAQWRLAEWQDSVAAMAAALELQPA